MDAITNKNITFDTDDEARAVLQKLQSLLADFHEVTLAEYYQLVDITPTHTDYKFGWRDLDNTQIVYGIEGAYTLNFPSPEHLGEKGRASTDYRLTVVYSDGSNRTLYPSTQTDVSNLIAHEIRMCNNKEDVNIVTFHVAFAWKGK